VADYDGSPARARDLLEALVMAEEEGVPASSFSEACLSRPEYRTQWRFGFPSEARSAL